LRILQGQPQNITFPIMGKVSRNKFHLGLRKNSIYVAERLGKRLPGYAGMVAGIPEHDGSFPKKKPAVFGLSSEDLSYLQEGDIVILEPTGQINVVWDADSPHNSILVTNACNCK
jgi:hypothetical protein